MFIYAIRCLGSMTEEKWESKLQLFQSLGLSMDETLALFRKSTAAFAVSERKIKEKADYLVSNGKCDLAYLLAHAFLFSISLEGRIKPRLLVWETLKKKGLISESYKLSQICKVTDKDFFEKYVYPYENEVESLFKSKKVLMK
ncbi:hypothetical protein IFM89_008449 [Coptis chinensis]|uniref:Uncharacterized protein n=1 Tax=Coptis chinensis TaxID=261450 RepID=A0A835IB41_9MAGN|nr:hypothetical protein IFM89_008449 [Coptis chinensis]